MSLPLPKADLLNVWSETCQQGGLRCQTLEGVGLVGALVTPAWNMAANTDQFGAGVHVPSFAEPSLTKERAAKVPVAAPRHSSSFRPS